MVATNYFYMKQEVEFAVSISNGYLYGHRLSVMGDNANRQIGADRTLSISLLMFIKLHI